MYKRPYNKQDRPAVQTDFKKVGMMLGSFHCSYYSDMPVAVGDKVVVTTRYGIVPGKVMSVDGSPYKDPFKEGHATQHIIENTTQKIYEKGYIIMAGTKTVEVKHISSNRKGIFFTDLDLKIGDTVVYDGNCVGIDNSSDGSMNRASTNTQSSGMHVGVVTNIDPDILTAATWIVDVVDLEGYQARIERAKRAAKLKQQLDAKRKQFQDIELLRLIAANDPETAALLDAYLKEVN